MYRTCPLIWCLVLQGTPPPGSSCCCYAHARHHSTTVVSSLDRPLVGSFNLGRGCLGANCVRVLVCYTCPIPTSLLSKSPPSLPLTPTLSLSVPASSAESNCLFVSQPSAQTRWGLLFSPSTLHHCTVYQPRCTLSSSREHSLGSTRGAAGRPGGAPRGAQARAQARPPEETFMVRFMVRGASRK